jgi:hypothetical protein
MKVNITETNMELDDSERENLMHYLEVMAASQLRLANA